MCLLKPAVSKRFRTSIAIIARAPTGGSQHGRVEKCNLVRRDRVAAPGYIWVKS
jgi:hypothetical protein